MYTDTSGKPRYPYTDLDMATSNKSMVMLKACISLLDPPKRKPVIMYIKLREFLSAINLSNNNPLFIKKQKSFSDPAEVLGLFNDYLDENEKNTINNFKEMFEMIELIKSMDLEDL